MTGNETKVVFGGQTMVHARICLDESTTPVAIDHLNVGRGRKTITRGIFEWLGDQARFCMAAPGKARPSDFSCDAGSGRTLRQWKRKG
ncbi:MAG TPA: hypothetical protein VL173_16895 [Vicinamibacterales bacterium]|jgi:uncharacterized protein (TIGR03067 family)|nr:hypothetical protein [Vicinamibacterales bacterium]